MVEQETCLRMAPLQVGGSFPAHVAENVPWASCFDDGDVGAVHQLVERACRFGVSRVGENPVVDPYAVAIGAAGAVVELDRLVFVAGNAAGWLRDLVGHVESIAHRQMPILSPAHLKEGLQT